MKKILMLLGILILVGTASAVTWADGTGCWTATDGSDTLVMWNATGTSTYVVPASSITYLVVAGGGAGGSGSPGNDGGGGAGGLLNGSFAAHAGSSYTIVVGIGGTTRTGVGNNGGNSSFKNVTYITLDANGGGGGGQYESGVGGNGAPGGSGGGAPQYGTYTIGGATTPAGQGYKGADAPGTAYGGSGGGGAGQIGQGATGGNGATGGAGGNGLQIYIDGVATYYSGGGAGGSHITGGSATAGGSGGGGSGHFDATAATAGTDGLGGGGGGGGESANGAAGGSGVVIIRYTTPAATHDPIPSFTSSATTGTPPLSVQFNDTSVTSITNWSWNFGEGNTSTIQNATNTFYNGNHYVTLSVTNASGSSSTPAFAWINVSASGGLSGWNRQDIIMDQIYTVTFLVKDSATHSGISGALVSLSNGDNSTTDLFGSVSFSMNYSAIVAQFGATGYNSRTISYVIDRDRTETVYLTAQAIATNTTSNTNVVYIPKQIEITVMYYNPAGVVVPAANVSLTAIANTLQADEQLETLYGINPIAANQLMNGTLIMQGSTGADGGIVFTILQSIHYQARVTDPATSVVYTATLFPGQDPYTIWIGTNPIKNATPVSQLFMNQTRLFVTQPDAGNITNNLIYRDFSGRTTRVDFIVKYAANGTIAYTANATGFGTNAVYMNYTHPNIRGMGVYYGWNATKT